jgi:hypothetical protein
VGLVPKEADPAAYAAELAGLRILIDTADEAPTGEAETPAGTADDEEPGSATDTADTTADTDQTPSTPTGDEEITPLNGAQITAVLDILAKVATGELPRDGGAIMLSQMLGIDPASASALVSGIDITGPPSPDPEV